MIPETFKNRKILVVGGAGFVGSNLTLKLLEDDPAEVLVIDNLLSSEASNVPVGNNLRFVYGSITDDAILHALPDDLDYVFHLACYHGNQSSIANPLADHENNTLTLTYHTVYHLLVLCAVYRVLCTLYCVLCTMYLALCTLFY